VLKHTYQLRALNKLCFVRVSPGRRHCDLGAPRECSLRPFFCSRIFDMCVGAQTEFLDCSKLTVVRKIVSNQLAISARPEFPCRCEDDSRERLSLYVPR